MKIPLTTRSRNREFDVAIADLKLLNEQLKDEPVPQGRSELYTTMALKFRTLRRTVNLRVMPALEPGDGTSYEQGYTDMAAIANLLSLGEVTFALRGPGPAGDHYRGCPLAERLQWDRYFTSGNRLERAEILFALYEMTASRIGYEAASVINMAGWSERAIAGTTPKTRT